MMIIVGRQACGRILEGVVQKRQTHSSRSTMDIRHSTKSSRIEGYHGFEKIEMDEAGVGDIVSISGVPEVTIGDTLCDPNNIVRFPPITAR